MFYAMSEGIGRRQFLEYVLATGMTAAMAAEAIGQDAKTAQEIPQLKKNRITYDLAKKLDDAGKQKYLEQLLRDEWKLVYDEKKNPEGFVSCYFWPNKKQREAATKRIEQYIIAEGLPDKASEYAKAYDEKLRIDLLCARVPGQKNKGNFAVVGNDIFSYANEDELFSSLDHATGVLTAYEQGLAVDGKFVNFKNTTLRIRSNDLIQARARQAQYALLEKRKNVSAETKAEVTKEYLTRYGRCMRHAEEAQKDWEASKIDDFKEAAETLKAFAMSLDSGMKAVGYYHAPIAGKEFEYELVKSKK